MSPLELVAVARPGVAVRVVEQTDEVVLHGGGEVFRLPLTDGAVRRHALLVRALPKLAERVPVAVPWPRYGGVLEDGATPFTAEARLPGAPLTAPPDGIALSQVAGMLLALRAVPAKEARQWGADGAGDCLVHGDLDPASVLVAPTGVVTGVVGWRPRLGTAHEDVTRLGVDPLG